MSVSAWPGEVLTHGFGPVGIVREVTLQDVGEEKQFQNREHYEEFQENNHPKSSSESHLAESGVVEVPDTHRQRRTTVVGLCIHMVSREGKETSLWQN